MTPSELKKLLYDYGITPVRSRGQHFLLDESVVRAMVAAAGIEKGMHVVEIGPGPGILTAELLQAGADVVGIEIDITLARLLRDRFRGATFRLLEGDAARFSNARLSEEFGGAAYRVVANLPYGITSETLIKYLSEKPLPESLTVMIQREVADRIMAEPGEMSALAVFVQTLGEPRRVINVPAAKFFPPPKVSSTVVHIRLKSREERAAFFAGLAPEHFFALVRIGFAGKRKKLKNCLSGPISASKIDAAEVFSAAKVSPDLRPEDLAIEDWRRLAVALRQ
ncbi:ribosomal RNA small subunit methyltransferase A [Candidatus Uhrbacteria bacterium]|nr:ribosomal RNA small subunit methyltransferase A [Candidatus Uhrbacteria bacterium]